MRRYSIVTTIYNSEKYLKQCIESVRQQTYTNWELILVNDGSNDNSGLIAKEFAESVNSDETDSNVIYLEHENKGAVFSRERGIGKTSGEYILFLDSDDWWETDLLQRVNDIIDETDADIIQYGYMFKDEEGNDTLDAGVCRKGAYEGREKYMLYDDSNIFFYEALRTCYSLWSRAFKSTLFNKTEGFLERFYDVNMTNDLLALSWPLSQANTYCIANFYPYYYRIVGTSLCHDVSIKKICSYFRSLGWAEECLLNRNGNTKENIDFFSDRLSNIIFDEYRVNIYTSSNSDINDVYTAASSVKNLELYLKEAVKKSNNWYKTAYLKAFNRKGIIVPKLLYVYSQIRNKGK